MPSPRDACILETVFGKKNSKVTSDKRQTLQQNLKIIGIAALEQMWRGNMLIGKPFCCATTF